MTSVLAELTSQEKQDECVAHALSLRTAWSLQNYKRFFKEYLQAPKMSGYLIDWFVARERKAALRIILKAYVFIRTITGCLFTLIILTWVNGKHSFGCHASLFQEKFHVLRIVSSRTVSISIELRYNRFNIPTLKMLSVMEP